MDDTSRKVFLTVAEEGSFRKAASVLGYTQAGISYIISSLEQEFGLPLFIRKRNGVDLTPEGNAVLPKIRQLQIDSRSLQETLTELKGLEQGSLRIQIFDSMSIHWLPGILQEFTRDYPHVSIDLISEEDSRKAEEMVLSGEVDCGFFLTDVSAPIDVFTLKEEQLYAIVSKDHELADADRFPIAKLGDYPYIGMKYDDHTGMKDIFRSHHARPATAFCLDNDFAAMAMVSKGFGYAIFPELLLKDVPFELRMLKFDEPQKRTIRIGTRSMDTASRACLKFIEYTRRWISENT